MCCGQISRQSLHLARFFNIGTALAPLRRVGFIHGMIGEDIRSRYFSTWQCIKFQYVLVNTTNSHTRRSRGASSRIPSNRN